MSGGTLTPPRDPGPPGGEELLARVVPLRRRDEAQQEPVDPPQTSTGPIVFATSDTPRVGLTPRAVWGNRATSLRPHDDSAAVDASASATAVQAPRRGLRRTRVVALAAIAALLATAAVVASESLGHAHHAPPRHVVTSKTAPRERITQTAKIPTPQAHEPKQTRQRAHQQTPPTSAGTKKTHVHRSAARSHAAAHRTESKSRTRTGDRATVLTAKNAPQSVVASSTSPPTTPPPQATAPIQQSATPTHNTQSVNSGASSCVPGELGC
jgi:hypothetical protein